MLTPSEIARLRQGDKEAAASIRMVFAEKAKDRKAT
jgi:hypothetical protein